MNLNQPSLSEVNTSYPGFAYNFNPETQTCDVQLAIENLFIGMFDPYNIVKSERLIGVPVKFVQGGGWSITHPVPDKTPVYVTFAQRGTDHYFEEGKEEAGLINGHPSPAFSQRFTQHACVCTVGYQPKPNVIKGFNSNDFELRNSDRSQRVSLKDGGVIEVISGSSKIIIEPSGAISMDSPTAVNIKAPNILLDGITTITKTLNIQSGVEMVGASGTSTFNMSGNLIMKGSFTLNGIPVGTHTHTNPEGGNVGPMKAS